jgi:murein DD-endopeptidase MepM/ murein hydrolase activator NlpD
VSISVLQRPTATVVVRPVRTIRRWDTVAVALLTMTISAAGSARPSPWFDGRHRIMIPFGCTRAPYYAPDPRCVRQRGFHHGIDIAMKCGTKLFSNVRGRIAPRWGGGALGSAYGSQAFRLRSNGRDYVFGHVRRSYFNPGQRVRRGELIARAGKRGAPDGCHLHFEVRPQAGSYTQAIAPRERLELSRRPQ